MFSVRTVGAEPVPRSSSSPELIAEREGDEPPPTFAYVTPYLERHYLRAALEFHAVLVQGFLWYATTTRKNWQVDYSWPVFRNKLAGHAFSLDTNHFGTNFIGHPLGGTGYYLSARGNRLGILSSFAFAEAGSALWELFGEVGEVISTNDMIVTPIAGVALGEPFTQLGAFFDRSADSGVHRTLGSVFGPFKSMNDAFDGVRPKHATNYDRFGFPSNEWHRFELGASLAFTGEDARAEHAARVTEEGRLVLASDLARLTGYTSAAHRDQWFSDANLSSISLEMSFLPSGVSDLWFTTRAVLLGHYYRNAVFSHGALRGGGTVFGLATGFSYSAHDYERGVSGPNDRLASVRPLGLVVESRATVPGIELSAELDLGPDFAGVKPLALSGYLQTADVSSLPPVVQAHGYYFGAGYHLNSSVAARIGDVELRGRLRNDHLLGLGFVKSSNSTGRSPSFQDIRTVGEIGWGYYVQRNTLFTLDLQRRLRVGRAGKARAEVAEWSFGTGFQAVL